MLEETSRFLNNYPLIGIIIVIFIVFVIIYYTKQQNCANNKEHLIPNVSTQSINTDSVFHNTYVGKTKKVNFKCKYDGIEYYLASIKASDCSNVKTTVNNPDCGTAVIILIPVDDMKDLMKSYMSKLKLETEKCNSDKKIECLYALENSENKDNTNIDEAKKECEKPSPLCDHKRFYIHDFNVIQVTSTTPDPNNGKESLERRKYIIRGTGAPLIEGSTYPTILNQYLYHDKSINLLCGDDYNYGATPSEKEYAELVVIEKENTNTGGIIGGSSNNIKVKLRFNTKVQIVSTNKEGKTVYVPLFDDRGKVRTKQSYVGICPNNKTCKLINGKSYPRACLYDDILDINVLEFDPILVTERKN